MRKTKNAPKSIDSFAAQIMDPSGHPPRRSAPAGSVVDLGLPHRPPFIFVRELIACDPGISAECATTFESDDPMFAGHFPGNPLVPGVILTEALAQTAGIAAAAAHAENARPRFLLSAIRGMKFFHAVRPQERIVLRAEKLAEIDDLLQFKAEALVNGKQVAAGQIVLSVAPEAAPS